MCHHCGDDNCNNTCCSGASTGDTPFLNTITGNDSGDITCGTTFTCTGCNEECFFCDNNCIECIQYENRTLHVCSTHRDSLKGRLGQTQTYYPYYTPEAAFVPIWPPVQPWTGDPIERF